MTRSDFAVLLPLAPLLLTLAACASEPERAGRSGRAQPSPFGFEMASTASAVDGQVRRRDGGILVRQEVGQPLGRRSRPLLDGNAHC